MSDWRVPLWEEINRYVVACGGDPGKHVYGNVSRMNAVVAVERVVKDAIEQKMRMKLQMLPFDIPESGHCLGAVCLGGGCACGCISCVAARAASKSEI